MDKARHPHVIRTWRVERTKVPYRPPQPAKLPSQAFFNEPRHQDKSSTPPSAAADKDT